MYLNYVASITTQRITHTSCRIVLHDLEIFSAQLQHGNIDAVSLFFFYYFYATFVLTPSQNFHVRVWLKYQLITWLDLWVSQDASFTVLSQEYGSGGDLNLNEKRFRRVIVAKISQGFTIVGGRDPIPSLELFDTSSSLQSST